MGDLFLGGGFFLASAIFVDLFGEIASGEISIEKRLQFAPTGAPARTHSRRGCIKNLVQTAAPLSNGRFNRFARNIVAATDDL